METLPPQVTSRVSGAVSGDAGLFPRRTVRCFADLRICPIRRNLEGIVVWLLALLLAITESNGVHLSETNFKELLIESNYDPLERPQISKGSAVAMKVQMEIGYMGDIDTKKMTFEIHATFRQWWHDERLVYNVSMGSKVVGLKSLRDLIWTPTLFFINEKDSKLVVSTRDNVYVQIDPDGNVYYALRLQLVLSCPMNLKHYPFDKQSCRIRVSSWSYDMNALILRWHDECVTFLESVELPEHFLDKDDVICKAFNSTYETSGDFSGLVAHLRFRREIPYYLMEVYLPISLLVIGSWLSFWLDVYAVPARTALGITTILTIITSSRGIKESIPRVSYVKAVDVWIETCTWLVFCALLEFPFVNFIARKGKENDDAKANANASAKTTSNKIFQVVRQPNKVSVSIANGPTVRPFGEETTAVQDVDPVLLLTEQTAKSVDRVCRFLFPCAFVIFNLIYWFTWAP
uniref:Cys-loop ligand-gated ion channel subunit n=1 Tax=Pardosa pseudoannulata TaxID=330961 RepID=A0AA51YE63_9ARAC|nr:cys-loop ligand-gated ion channel subunit [Pardosa pseudoannulata]